MLTYFYLDQVDHRAVLESHDSPKSHKYYRKELAPAEKLQARAIRYVHIDLSSEFELVCKETVCMNLCWWSSFESLIFTRLSYMLHQCTMQSNGRREVCKQSHWATLSNSFLTIIKKNFGSVCTTAAQKVWWQLKCSNAWEIFTNTTCSLQKKIHMQ
jgi:hypothetical protein